jgi:hypothetical protein
MKRSNKWGLLAAILASLLALPEAFAADPNIERQASALLQERYETVVGTRSNLLSQLHLGDPKADPYIQHLGIPFYYLIAGLKAVGPTTFAVVGASSELVFTGARDFTYPTGLGGVMARFCYIAVLTDGERQAIADEFSEVPRIALGGMAVWTWSLPPFEGHDTEITFYAALSDTAFVVANDRQDLLDALDAMAKQPSIANSSKDSASASVREHGYWAQSEARQQTWKHLPFPAVKVELWTQLDDDRLILNVVPADPSTQLPAAESAVGLIQLQRNPAGIWEATIPLRASQTMMYVFQVMALLGYAIVL